MYFTLLFNRIVDACSYPSRTAFLNELELVFRNCETFNEDESDIVRQAQCLRAFCRSRWLELTGEALGLLQPLATAGTSSAVASMSSSFTPVYQSSVGENANHVAAGAPPPLQPPALVSPALVTHPHVVALAQHPASMPLVHAHVLGQHHSPSALASLTGPPTARAVPH